MVTPTGESRVGGMAELTNLNLLTAMVTCPRVRALIGRENENWDSAKHMQEATVDMVILMVASRAADTEFI